LRKLVGKTGIIRVSWSTTLVSSQFNGFVAAAVVEDNPIDPVASPPN